MASPHSGFPNQNIELLRVETNLFDLYIQGKPFHPTVETLQLHRRNESEWVEATLQVVPDVSVLEISNILAFSSIEGRLVDLGRYPIFPCFYEYQNYQLVIQKKADIEVDFYHENRFLRQAVKPLGNEILTGVLNFQDEVGYTDLEIRVAGNTVLNIRLEIFPSKIDYKTDYERILAEVNEEIYNLSFDFLRKTYQMTALRETQNQSLTEFFSILQIIFRQLVDSVDRIKSAPQYRLDKENHIVIADKVKRAGKENISFLSKHPHLLQREDTPIGIVIDGRHYRPTYLIETKRRLNFDTTENRFLRWMLLRIRTKLQEILIRLKKRESNPDSMLVSRIERMTSQLNRLLRYDFLQEVGEMKQMAITLVLQMAPGYRDAYRFYLMLMKGLSIQGDLFRLSMKDLAQLYEYWCFLKIHSLLKKKYELVHQDIIRLNRNGLFVTLDKSQSASVTYRNPRNRETFTLFYNSLPSEDGKEFPTLAQRPDNVLTLKKEDSQIEYKYVFDAKYRLNPAYEGTSYHQKYGGLPGPEEDDINTMHRYRDAIVYHEGHTASFERSMFGAYVLFPYSDEEKFKQHHFYRSIKKVNVGAFPFLPNSTKLVEEFLDELIMDSPEKAFERSLQPRGTQKYYADKFSGKSVLVGSLGAPEQLKICLTHKFYYIPLKRLIKQQKALSQLEVVALYQSKTFFGEKECGVKYWGRVSNWSVIPRKEIIESPVRRNNPDELYVRFEIEEWNTLEKPILPGGHSVYDFLLTSMYIFQRAKEIAELKLESEEQLLEWREKRRLGKVKVELNNQHVDLATKVLDVKVEEDVIRKPD